VEESLNTEPVELAEGTVQVADTELKPLPGSAYPDQFCDVPEVMPGAHRFFAGARGVSAKVDLRKNVHSRHGRVRALLHL
jgi:hypothetical protein